MKGKKYKGSYLEIVFLIAFLFSIFSFMYLHEVREKKVLSDELYFIYKQNFISNVEFDGIINNIDRFQGNNSICYDLYFNLISMTVDSSNIIRNNALLDFDLDAPGISIKIPYSVINDGKFKKVNRIHFNKYNNRKILLLGVKGDSLDVTSFFIGLSNSEANSCLKNLKDLD